MKKIVLSSLVAASLAVSSFAENNIYMGVGYSLMTGEHDAPYTVDYGSYYESRGYTDYTTSVNGDIDLDGFSIKLGYKFDLLRLEVSYMSMNSEGTMTYYNGSTSDFDEKYTGFDFDVVVPFTKNEFKPYITLGIGSHQWEDYEVTDGVTDRDREAVSYNAGIGFLYAIDSLEFDIAYKYKLYKWEDVTYDGSLYDIDFTDEETSANGLYVGINIHF